MKPARDISRLIEIMAALRTPGTGCPWDLEQDFQSIAPYTIEEAYEVADAIERCDWHDLTDELGDLLLQVVFHSRIAEESGLFAFPDVVEAITSKLVRRHPHVFGDTKDLTPDQVKALWGQIKAEEKAERRLRRGITEAQEPKGLLSGIPHALPGLTRAVKLQSKASSVGFDWNDARLVIDKIKEEIAELEQAAEAGDHAEIRGEIGDLIFAVANLARHVDVDPEDALRLTNAKFERRFSHIEKSLDSRGRSLSEATLAEMDALWDDAKARERQS
jgi:ATP diphosphatase